jgi:katanin p60 ATPase-containing subunit A1
MMAMRASSDSSSAEQKRLAERRKGILILIHQHLLENGYIDAATKLVHEAGQVITKFEVADNMDLTLILGEYESYYEMRFDKKPKLIRKLDEGSTKPGASKLAAKRASSKSSSVDISYTGYESKDSARPSTNKLPQVTGASTSGNPEDDAQDKDKGSLEFGVQGTTVKPTKKVENEKVENLEDR